MCTGTDLIGTVCVAKDVGVGKTLAQLADACDAMYHAAAGSGIGCAGFNTNGFLKKCVRSSCGAKVAPQQGGTRHVHVPPGPQRRLLCSRRVASFHSGPSRVYAHRSTVSHNRTKVTWFLL